jgi:general nucleoside transport system ATP-binding protein
MPGADTDIILEMRRISKIFPGVIANDNIDFNLKKGEVHSILGENGAGKSTLMNILSGVYHPTEGEIYLDGHKMHFESARDAIRKGIGMVYQHFMLVPKLTVAENIMLGIKRPKGLLLEIEQAAEEIVVFAKKYGMDIDPHAIVSSLTVGQQQRVEIVKALFRGARVLVLDEPSAVLTPKETHELFNMIRMLTDKNFSVVFISHKIDEVLEISDRISVLRRGKLVETLENSDVSKRRLASLMVGREVLFRVERAACCPGDAVLTLEDVNAKNEKGRQVLKNLSFSIQEGEVFGIAGVDGNGQSELLELITGLRRAESGSLCIAGEEVRGKSPRQILEMGLAHIPEDRHARGLVLNMDVKENFIINDYYRNPHTRRNKMIWPFIRKHTQENVDRFDVRTSSIDMPVANLSGGNQQKLILARELHEKPVLLAAMHATRGLDVGAIEYVHKRILEQRETGTAVLYISTELEELMNISDRIGVMFRGELMGIIKPGEIGIEEIGMMMAGTPLEKVHHT